MPALPKRSSAMRAQRKAIDISLAAPQVVAHRLTRMALAGPVLSSRDQQEFTNMVLEKQLAFAQSWLGAWQAAMQGPWNMAWSMWQNSLSPSKSAFVPWNSWQWMNQGMDYQAKVANAALAPIQRKAVSNARRLAKTPLVPKRSGS